MSEMFGGWPATYQSHIIQGGSQVCLRFLWLVLSLKKRKILVKGCGVVK